MFDTSSTLPTDVRAMRFAPPLLAPLDDGDAFEAPPRSCRCRASGASRWDSSDTATVPSPGEAPSKLQLTNCKSVTLNVSGS